MTHLIFYYSIELGKKGCHCGGYVTVHVKSGPNFRCNDLHRVWFEWGEGNI